MAAVPGLTVLFPSHRHPVGAILKKAVLCWPNPAIFFEHKLLYAEPVSPGEYSELRGNAQDFGIDLFPTLAWSTSSTPDVTLVSYGGMLPLAEQIRADLMAEELDVEIVAPSLLNPLPRHQLYQHLRSREAVIVIEEAYAETGFGSALGAALLEDGFSGRFARIYPPPVPIPAARSLESRILPGRAAILQQITRIIGV